MFKTYLYKDGELKLTESHGTELSATRSGQNWKMLRKGHTFKVVEFPEEKPRTFGSHIKDLIRGF